MELECGSKHFNIPDFFPWHDRHSHILHLEQWGGGAPSTLTHLGHFLSPNPQNRRGGAGGGLPSIVISAAVACLRVFVRDDFAPRLGWIAPHSLPRITPSLPHWVASGFPLVLPLLLTHSFSSKQSFAFSLGNVC